MSDNPYRSPPEAAPPSIDERNRLLGPAVALIVISVIWIAFALYGVVYFVSLINSPDAGAQTRHTFTMSIGWIVVSILYCLVLISGALSMVRRGSYVWAVVTSFLAMVPLLGPCYVLGIPVGIWAIVLLRRPGVKTSFRGN